MHKFLLFVILLLVLAGCNTDEKLKETLDPPSESSESEEETSEIVFPETGEMLSIECSPYEAFSFGEGSTITVKFTESGDDFTEHSFDLPKSEKTSEKPEITLFRRMDTGRIIEDSFPIDEINDWETVMKILSADFYAASENCGYVRDAADILITLNDGDEEKCYGVFADGTLCFFGESTEIAAEKADYYLFSALAYKYASDPYDIGTYEDAHWLFWAETLDSSEFPVENYKLCISGKDFHIDLDYNQAKILFSVLFDENELSRWGDTAEYSVLRYGETLSGEPIKFTEYLYNENTTYHEFGDPETLCTSHYFYPDGTILQPVAGDEWTYFYSGNIGIISSSYKRSSVTENAFDGGVLESCIDFLLKA